MRLLSHVILQHDNEVEWKCKRALDKVFQKPLKPGPKVTTGNAVFSKHFKVGVAFNGVGVARPKGPSPLGESGGMPPQEIFNFYTLGDAFYSILRHKQTHFNGPKH